jgi:putative nucleotidyltransferase with HDIG domain
MKSLPRPVRVYIGALILIAVVLSIFSISSLATEPHLLHYGIAIVVFTLAIFLADLYPIVLPTEGNAEVTISCAFKTAAVIIFGSPVAILSTLLGTLLAEMTLRRAWYKSAFNAAEMTLTTACMSLVYRLFLRPAARFPFGDLAVTQALRTPFGSAENFAGVCTVILTYLLVNVGLVTIVVSLATGASFGHVWKANFRDSSWNNLTIIPLGAVLASLWIDHAPWAIVFLVLPMIVVRQSFHYIGEYQRQTREALIRMADAIDHRDPYTYQHSRRVASISEAIAESLGLPTEDVELIGLAGRLHDLGKIGMSNTLLFKPQRFTDDERQEFEAHPTIGAELVKSFRLFEEGQNLILHHHERYDGTGYPRGLSGEAIPLGSRILAVADAYDAMISRRVYRPALSLEAATGELRKNSGTQFDPQVVNALLDLLNGSDARVPVSDVGVQVAVT